MKSNLPIGIFDSGIGGLTVYNKVRNLLPQENIIYFGDTGRIPYGSRPQEQIGKFADEIMKFMSLCNIKLGIVACNTITVLGIENIAKHYNFDLVGTSLGAASALRASKNKRIGVIATEVTIKSGRHRAELLRLDPAAKVVAQACPTIASLVEKGLVDDEGIKADLTSYLTPLVEQEIDTVILGCTHYPFITGLIQEVLGEQVMIIDPAIETAEIVRDVLINSKAVNQMGEGNSRLYFSAKPEQAKCMASKLFNTDSLMFEQFDLELLANYCARYDLFRFDRMKA